MRPFKVEFSRNRTRNLGGPINALTTGKREWEGEVGMTGNGSGRFCPRMAERGIGRVAHGTHGIHGKGGGIRRRRRRITRRGRSFLPRKTRWAEGGGRRRCPRIARRDANGEEGIRKSGPRNTRNTRKGGGEVGTAETERGTKTEFLPTEHTETGRAEGGIRRRRREKILARVGGGPSVARS